MHLTLNRLSAGGARSLPEDSKWNKTIHHVENINKYLHLQIAWHMK